MKYIASCYLDAGSGFDYDSQSQNFSIVSILTLTSTPWSDHVVEVCASVETTENENVDTGTGGEVVADASGKDCDMSGKK